MQDINTLNNTKWMQKYDRQFPNKVLENTPVNSSQTVNETQRNQISWLGIFLAILVTAAICFRLRKIEREDPT